MNKERKFSEESFCMYCNYSSALQLFEQLKLLGYEIKVKHKLSDPFLGIIIQSGKVFSLKNAPVILSYNPVLLLALAAMSEGEEFYPGEYAVKSNACWSSHLLGKAPEYLVGDIVKVIEVKILHGNHKPVITFWNGKSYGDDAVALRKATVEELISHFTKNGDVSKNGTDEKKSSISGDPPFKVTGNVKSDGQVETKNIKFGKEKPKLVRPIEWEKFPFVTLGFSAPHWLIVDELDLLIKINEFEDNVAEIRKILDCSNELATEIVDAFGEKTNSIIGFKQFLLSGADPVRSLHMALGLDFAGKLIKERESKKTAETLSAQINEVREKTKKAQEELTKAFESFIGVFSDRIKKDEQNFKEIIGPKLEEMGKKLIENVMPFFPLKNSEKMMKEIYGFAGNHEWRPDEKPKWVPEIEEEIFFKQEGFANWQRGYYAGYFRDERGKKKHMASDGQGVCATYIEKMKPIVSMSAYEAQQKYGIFIADQAPEKPE